MTTLRVDVRPELLRWARERSGATLESLTTKFSGLASWESGELRPTLKQLESYAKTTYTPIGFFFLSTPPVERLPIPDFRAGANARGGHPSPNLLETVYICQQRQEWYRDYARAAKQDPLEFVGSAELGDEIESTAAIIRHRLGFDLDERRELPTWTDALRRCIEQADAAGVLVMCSGVVRNNNRRKLDPDEFRGFALADGLAPLVFINGADTKAAQMFTLAHEIAHIWLGATALSDAEAGAVPDHDVERWCNQVAAETLVPLAALSENYDSIAELSEEVPRLARSFKVSTLVILRRIHDARGLTRQEYWDAYHAEVERLRALPRGRGGNFYLTQGARLSKRFARAVIESTLEGQTLYRDAFHMLGFPKLETFHKLGESLGLAD